MTPDEILGHRPRLLSRAQREFFFWRIVEGEATREIHSDALRLKLPPDWDAYEGVRIDNLYQRQDG